MPYISGLFQTFEQRLHSLCTGNTELALFSGELLVNTGQSLATQIKWIREFNLKDYQINHVSSPHPVLKENADLSISWRWPFTTPNNWSIQTGSSETGTWIQTNDVSGNISTTSGIATGIFVKVIGQNSGNTGITAYSNIIQIV